MTMRRRFTSPRTILRTGAAVACVAAALAGGPSHAQPGRGFDDRPPEGELTPERLRERIESRLAEVRSEEATLEDALAALDDGAPAQEVVRDIFRDRRRDDDRHEITDADLTPERREAMLAFLRETAPPLADRVERELEENPARSDEIFRRLAPRVLPQIELRERDPELFDLRAKAMRLDWRIRQAAWRSRFGEEAERESERRRLESLIAERVDATLEERALMLARFEKRIETMRAELDAERERREQIVAEKIAEIERGEFDRGRRGDGRRDR